MPAYQLKIMIKDSHPPIWRRILMPMQTTFADLHHTIQEIFGWTDTHLAAFRADELWIDCRNLFAEDLESEDGLFAEGEILDEWISVGDTFQYVYDFGDDWVHVIKVEKVVEYENRYPMVIKSKGPCMIEDCGGIWGFEECRDEAFAFDMEAVNAELSSWELPVAEMACWGDDEDDWDEEDSFADWLNVEENLPLDEPAVEEALVKMFGKAPDLVEVYRAYTKEELKTMAQAMGLNGYSYYKKEELTVWMADQMLQESHMKYCMENIHPQELDIFVEAMRTGGKLLPIGLLEESLFLAVYGAYTMLDEECGFYRIPQDVQERYRKVMSPEFAVEHKKMTEFRYYCEGAAYLYGVIPTEQFVRLYRGFEGDALTEEVFHDRLLKLSEKEDSIVYTGDYIMGREWAAGDSYQELLKQQGSREYYVPASKEEILSYGAFGLMPHGQEIDFFVEYLEEEFDLATKNALGLLAFSQIMLRNHAKTEEILAVLKDGGCRLNTASKRKKAEEQLLKLSRRIRRPELKGFTMEEALRPLNKENQSL